ncbi:MAG: dihydrolipoyl dehydrogenase [Anaerolineae bacterium]|nr:dihydrolipoyl dehydrogenase [Anaerolineae bacterium]MDQ7035607.1 dihydrolipoyl dehydrogenase [Anaerolineae bacterium]
MAKDYDVVVVGAGPGGYVAAIRASQLGLKCAVVEKKFWGGVCLNVGCIPSKALLHNAELAEAFIQHGKDFGISGDVKFDYKRAWERSREVSAKHVKGVHYLMKSNKIDEYDGWATFKDANSLEVALNDGKKETLNFKHAVIATGAVDNTLPGVEFSDNVIGWETQIMTDNLPKSIIIAGGGVIGIEFSYIMANYGVDVTIVEFMNQVLPNEDKDVVKQLTRAYKKLGVKILTGTAVKSIEDTGKGVKVTVEDRKKGETKVLEADRAMVAIGFKPRTTGFGLENTGVKLTERGAIDINSKMQTNIPHIYAIGDVTAKLMLAHVAETMGIVAAENIAGAETVELDFDFMPRAIYCTPQIASFGYTEEQAKEKGYEINVAKFPFQANGKASGLGNNIGFVKLISDKKYGEILGAHMIGVGVTELLPELTLARQWELTGHEIARNVHAHPTLSEALKEAAHGLEGKMINL